MLRLIYKDQPASHTFTRANSFLAEGRISEYKAERQTSAIIGTMDIVFGEVAR